MKGCGGPKHCESDSDDADDAGARCAMGSANVREGWEDESVYTRQRTL